MGKATCHLSCQYMPSDLGSLKLECITPYQGYVCIVIIHLLDYNSLTFQAKDTIEPVWMDLAYVPHHGASNYANSEFFKRVRARYYVFSGVEPSKEVFNALLEAKKTWENKEQGTSYIRTRVLQLS